MNFITNFLENPLPGIFDTVISCAMLLLFFRFMIQFAGFDNQHPYADSAYRLTRIVDIVAKLIPNLAQNKVSTAAVFLMLALRFIDVFGNAMLLANTHANGVTLGFIVLFSSLIDFLQMLIYVLFLSLGAQWIIILTEKVTPLTELFSSLSDPIVEPFRRFSPNVGMIDLSFLITWLALSLLKWSIENIAVRLLGVI